MRKHGGTPFRRDKHVTLAAISPPGVARGRFVGGQQSGLAGCKPPPLFTRGASSCSSQGRRQGEPRGASPRPSAPTYLPTCMYSIRYQVPGPGGDCSASKGPVNPYPAHRVPAATVTTTVAVAYTANIGVTRRPRWSHRSKATTKIHQATPNFPRPAGWGRVPTGPSSGAPCPYLYDASPEWYSRTRSSLRDRASRPSFPSPYYHEGHT